MKHLLAALATLLVATANAATPLPAELLGIWANPGAVFQGDALRRGSAIYLDTDGMGALLGASDIDVLGVMINVTSYDPDSAVIGVDIIDNGKVVGHSTLSFDRKDQALVNAEGTQRYYRHASEVSAMMRKALGLRPRSP